MKAKKENKVYRIATEQEKQRYLKEGFDIYDDTGTILEHSPLKKISYSEYAKLQAENEKLRKKLNESEGTAEETQETVTILRRYAQEHGIDIGRASTASGIVKKIMDQRPGGTE